MLYAVTVINLQNQTRMIFSEAAERNKQPILNTLRPLLANRKAVLEIGSGTGQHAVFFAPALPHLVWQPTELPDKLAMLTSMCRSHPSENLAPPLPLDIDDDHWPTIQADAVFTANTLHIIHWRQVCRLFSRAGALLPQQGIFCTYGPFNRNGRYTSASNAQFDEWLKNRDPESGIRDMNDLRQLAEECAITLVHDFAMPANNHLLVWRKN
ncbi:MAG: class I SAM-dependent methyltransferase [Nitrosomonas sp.]|nr:class I SAM-dependent methyltransferase [Nitrosomonas sp.]